MLDLKLTKVITGKLLVGKKSVFHKTASYINLKSGRGPITEKLLESSKNMKLLKESQNR